jgi:hypothetical protein
MNKYLIGILFLFGVTFFACSPKVVPTTNEPIPPTTDVSSMSPDALTGKKIYGNQCIGCHEAKNIKSYSSIQWATILPEMIEAAKLNMEEGRQVALYIDWELGNH